MNCSVSASSEDVMSLEKETDSRRETKRDGEGPFVKRQTAHSILMIMWNPFRASSTSTDTNGRADRHTVFSECSDDGDVM